MFSPNRTRELRSRTHLPSLRFWRTKKIIGRALTCTRTLCNGIRNDSVISECRWRRVQQWRGNANVSRQLLDCVLLFALYKPDPHIQSPTFMEHSRSLARANRLQLPPSLSSVFSLANSLFVLFIRDCGFPSVDPHELSRFSAFFFISIFARLFLFLSFPYIDPPRSLSWMLITYLGNE